MEDDEKSELSHLAIEVSAESLVVLDAELRKTDMLVQFVDLVITVMGAKQPAIRFWFDLRSRRWTPDTRPYRVCTEGVPSLIEPWKYYICADWVWYPTLRDAWYSFLTPDFLQQAEDSWSRVVDRFTSMWFNNRNQLVADEFLDMELDFGFFEQDKFVPQVRGYPVQYQHLVVS